MLFLIFAKEDAVSSKLLLILNLGAVFFLNLMLILTDKNLFINPFSDEEIRFIQEIKIFFLQGDLLKLWE